MENKTKKNTFSSQFGFVMAAVGSAGGNTMYREVAQELLSFIKSSPTPFHAVWNISGILEKEGFERRLCVEHKAGRKALMSQEMAPVFWHFKQGRRWRTTVSILQHPTAIRRPLN